MQLTVSVLEDWTNLLEICNSEFLGCGCLDCFQADFFYHTILKFYDEIFFSELIKELNIQFY